MLQWSITPSHNLYCTTFSIRWHISLSNIRRYFRLSRIICVACRQCCDTDVLEIKPRYAWKFHNKFQFVCFWKTDKCCERKVTNIFAESRRANEQIKQAKFSFITNKKKSGCTKLHFDNVFVHRSILPPTGEQVVFSFCCIFFSPIIITISWF